jgi:hypothetical protein
MLSSLFEVNELYARILSTSIRLHGTRCRN